MNTRGKLSYLLIIAIIGLIAMGAVMAPRTISAQVEGGYIGLERVVDLAEAGIQAPAGLAYSTQEDVLVFLATEVGMNEPSLVSLNRYEQLEGKAAPGTLHSNPQGMAFHPVSNRLYASDAQGKTLTQASIGPTTTGSNGEVLSTEGNLSAAGVAQVSGMAFDSLGGRMFLLDPAGSQLVTINQDALGGFTGGQVAKVSLQGFRGIQVGNLLGLAFNPANQHLYTLDLSSDTLIELSDGGAILGTYDLSPFGLVDPSGMVLAPSGDPTDDPEEMSLYVADQGRSSLLEFTFVPPPVVTAPSLTTVFNLVNTIQSSNWSPPSPDPMDIADMPNGNFLVVDSEVDETPHFAGANVFEITPAGNLVSTCNTLPFNKEPAGVAVNHSDGTVYFTDDVKLVIHMVHPGNDNQYCTTDDLLDSFSTSAFNSIDPEGLAYWQGQLFIGDGLGKEIFRVRAGENGVFDGVPPDGDDVVTSFDTEVLGLGDPEGVAYHPIRNTLFLVSNSNHILVETTLDGVQLNRDNLRDLNTIQMSGIAVGPSAVVPGQLNLFITDRGIDNSTDPNENDGRIYEISIGNTPVQTPTSPPTAVPPTPTSTSIPPTSVPQPTNTPQPTEEIPGLDLRFFIPLLSNSG